MRTLIRTSLRATLATTAALVLVGAASLTTAAEAAARPDVVTLAVTATRDPSTWFGWQRQFDTVDSVFALPLRTSTGGLQVEATKRDGSDSVGIRLEPGWGSPLRIGSYPDVTYDAAPTNPAPTFEMSVHGIELPGVVDLNILDLAYDTTGRITRADVTFTWSPHVAASSFVGELTLNEPVTGVQVSTPHVALPDYVTPAVALPVTERLRNTGSTSVTIGRLHIAGGDPADLSLAQDRCSGARLAPRAACTFVVRYAPTGSGPRAAMIEVPSTDASGTVTTQDVSVSGDVDDNHPVIRTWGDDYVDAGRRVVSRQGPFQITAYSSDPQGVVLEPSIVGPRGWSGNAGSSNVTVEVQAPSGSAITPGRHALGGSTGWDVSLRGFGRGCSIFDGVLDVSDIAYADGHLSHLGLTFDGRCGNLADGSAHGQVEYSAPTS